MGFADWGTGPGQPKPAPNPITKKRKPQPGGSRTKQPSSVRYDMPADGKLPTYQPGNPLIFKYATTPQTPPPPPKGVGGVLGGFINGIQRGASSVYVPGITMGPKAHPIQDNPDSIFGQFVKAAGTAAGIVTGNALTGVGVMMETGRLEATAALAANPEFGKNRGQAPTLDELKTAKAQGRTINVDNTRSSGLPRLRQAYDATSQNAPGGAVTPGQAVLSNPAPLLGVPPGAEALLKKIGIPSIGGAAISGDLTRAPDQPSGPMDPTTPSARDYFSGLNLTKSDTWTVSHVIGTVSSGLTDFGATYYTAPESVLGHWANTAFKGSSSEALRVAADIGGRDVRSEGEQAASHVEGTVVTHHPAADHPANAGEHLSGSELAVPDVASKARAARAQAATDKANQELLGRVGIHDQRHQPLPTPDQAAAGITDPALAEQARHAAQRDINIVANRHLPTVHASDIQPPTELHPQGNDGWANDVAGWVRLAATNGEEGHASPTGHQMESIWGLKDSVVALRQHDFMTKNGFENNTGLIAAINNSSTRDDAALAILASKGEPTSSEFISTHLPALAHQLAEVNREAATLDLIFGNKLPSESGDTLSRSARSWAPTISEHLGLDPKTWAEGDVQAYIDDVSKQYDDMARLQGLKNSSLMADNGAIGSPAEYVHQEQQARMQANVILNSADTTVDGKTIYHLPAKLGRIGYKYIVHPLTKEVPSGAYPLTGAGRQQVIPEFIAETQSAHVLRDAPEELRTNLINHVAANVHDPVQLRNALQYAQRETGLALVAQKYGYDPNSSEFRTIAAQVEADSKVRNAPPSDGSIGKFQVQGDMADGTSTIIEHNLSPTQVNDHYWSYPLNELDDNLSHNPLLKRGMQNMGRGVDNFYGLWKPLAVLKYSTSVPSTIEIAARRFGIVSAMKSTVVHLPGESRMLGNLTGNRAERATARLELDSSRTNADVLWDHLGTVNDNLAGHEAAQDASAELLKRGVIDTTGPMTINRLTPTNDFSKVSTERLQELAAREMNDTQLATQNGLRQALIASHDVETGRTSAAQVRVNATQGAKLVKPLEHTIIVRNVDGSPMMYVPGPGADPAAAATMTDLWSAKNLAKAVFTTTKSLREKQMKNAHVLGDVEIPAGHKDYWANTVDHINNHYRLDPGRRVIIRGGSLDEYSKAMNSPEGKAAINMRFENDVRNGNKPLLETAYREDKAFLDALIQTPEQRKRILEAPLRTEDEARLLLGGNAGLPTLKGTSTLGTAIKPKGIMATYRRVMERPYNLIIAKPEDYFGRVPIFKAAYEAHLQQWAQNTATHTDLEDMLPGTPIFKEGHQAAIEYATGQVKNNIYDVTRRSSLANMLRFIMPFVQASQNSAQYWGKMAKNNPLYMVRLAQIWDIPQQTNMLDAQGNFIFQPFGLKVSRANLANQLFVGSGGNAAKQVKMGEDGFSLADVPYMPGLGPLVQLPMEIASLMSPGTVGDVSGGFAGWLESYVMPGGTPSSLGQVAQNLAPTWMKKAMTAWTEDDGNPQFHAYKMRLAATQWMDWYTGARADKPNEAELNDATQYHMLFEAAASFALPGGGGKDELPGQPLVDEWHSLIASEGMNTARMTMIQKYGPQIAFLMTGSVKNNSGAPSTDSGRALMKDNPELVQQLASSGADQNTLELLFSGLDPKDPYSQDARNAQLKNPIPGSSDKESQPMAYNDLLRATTDQMGYDSYNQQKTLALNMLDARRGTLHGNFNKVKADILDNIVTRIGVDNPDWASSFRDFSTQRAGMHQAERGLSIIVSDQKFMDKHGEDPFWKAAKAFVDLRAATRVSLGNNKPKEGDSLKNELTKIDAVYAKQRAAGKHPRDATIKKAKDKARRMFALKGGPRQSQVMLQSYFDATDSLYNSNTQFADTYDKYFGAERLKAVGFQ